MSLLISNLSYKRKNEENLLHDINIEIDNGHLLVIQGESGCGKTTLLNIISGLLKPTDGLIKLNSNVLNFTFFFDLYSNVLRSKHKISLLPLLSTTFL